MVHQYFCSYSSLNRAKSRANQSDSALSAISRAVNQVPFDFPEDKLPENFSLIVSDLQQPSDNGLGLNGKLAFELKQDFERFSNPVVLQFANSILSSHAIRLDSAFKINRTITIVIDNTSYTLPEVRAGPLV